MWAVPDFREDDVRVEGGHDAGQRLQVCVLFNAQFHVLRNLRPGRRLLTARLHEVIQSFHFTQSLIL